MPPVRLTAFFRDDDGHGWSETHDRDGGADPVNLSPLITSFDNLMKTLRVPLLGRDGYYIGSRASYRTPGGKIAAAPFLLDVPMAGTQAIGSVKTWMNDADVAVKVRLANAASTANSDMYLRGVWDYVIEAGQLNFAGAVGVAFKEALDAYQTALTAGIYGWVGINPALTPRGNVTNYTSLVDETVQFTIAVTNGVAMPAVGSRVQVNFAKINRSRSILNRSLICIVTNATTLTTTQQIGTTPFETPGTFIIPTKSLIPYDHVAYRKVARRKTGRPFGVGRGRRSVQVLH